MARIVRDSPHLHRSGAEPKGVHDTFERLFDGDGPVCGVDEAGRGPLAGPVVAAAVVLPPSGIPVGIDDSKALTATQRVDVLDWLLAKADVSICFLGAATIERMNIRAASLEAMRRAIAGLATEATHALIDGNAIPEGLVCPATCLVKGDGRSVSIAAASIVAKVMRDRVMVAADARHPGYGLAAHKGYPVPAHREALMALGPSRLHRRNFAPVRAAASKP